MIVLLDTNVIIRFLTQDRSTKYKTLYSFFETLEQGSRRVELKLIVFFQVISVLKSYYQISKEEIANAMSYLLKYRGIKIAEKKIVQRTLELWRARAVEIEDCYLAACLERDTQNIIYSYDRDLDKFGLTRKKP